MGNLKPPSRTEQIRAEAQAAIDAAFANGFVITAHLEPRLPLAMGNYAPVVLVRERLVRG